MTNIDEILREIATTRRTAEESLERLDALERTLRSGGGLTSGSGTPTAGSFTPGGGVMRSAITGRMSPTAGGGRTGAPVRMTNPTRSPLQGATPGGRQLGSVTGGGARTQVRQSREFVAMQQALQQTTRHFQSVNNAIKAAQDAATASVQNTR